MIDLIVNADDFGLSYEVNQAIKECFEKNYINRASMLVNMPLSNEAASIAKDGGFSNRLGLHLNLTEGKPLSNNCKGTKLCDKDDEFSGIIHSKTFSRLIVDRKTSDAIYTELEAQILKFIGYGFNLWHIDSHQHTHTNLSVYKELRNLITKYNIESIRLARDIPTYEVSFVNKLYKRMINSLYSKVIKTSYKRTFKVTYMGTQDDVTKYLNESHANGVVEMMIHPYIDEDGKLRDKYNDLNIEDWLKNNNNKVRLV